MARRIANSIGRPARKAALCLTLGLLTTVAVAWFFALTASLIRRDHQYLWLQAVRESGPNIVRMYWWEGISVAAIGRFEEIDTAGSSSASRRQQLSLGWHADLFSASTPSGQRFITSCGWPLPALWCSPNYHRVFWQGSTNYRVIPSDHAINITGLRGVHSFRRLSEVAYVCAALPLRPIVVGMAADTGFYAACWWIMLFATRSARRALRTARNRCAPCGYDLCGTPVSTPCPECGHARPR